MVAMPMPTVASVPMPPSAATAPLRLGPEMRTPMPPWMTGKRGVY